MTEAEVLTTSLREPSAPYLGVARSLTGRGWRDRLDGAGVSSAVLREITQRMALMAFVEPEFVEPLSDGEVVLVL